MNLRFASININIALKKHKNVMSVFFLLVAVTLSIIASHSTYLVLVFSIRNPQTEVKC